MEQMIHSSNALFPGATDVHFQNLLRLEIMGTTKGNYVAQKKKKKKKICGPEWFVIKFLYWVNILPLCSSPYFA